MVTGHIIVGTSGNDTITGGINDDTLKELGGNDGVSEVYWKQLMAQHI